MVPSFAPIKPEPRIPTRMLSSETGPFFQRLGVARPLNRDLRGGASDLAEIVGRKFDCDRSDVLLQALQLRGAWDWNDPRFLSKQPGQRDLSRCRLLPLGDRAKQIRPEPDSPSEPPA